MDLAQEVKTSLTSPDDQELHAHQFRSSRLQKHHQKRSTSSTLSNYSEDNDELSNAKRLLQRRISSQHQRGHVAKSRTFTDKPEPEPTNNDENQDPGIWVKMIANTLAGCWTLSIASWFQLIPLLCYVLQIDNVAEAQDWLVNANPTGLFLIGLSFSIAFSARSREAPRHGTNQPDHARHAEPRSWHLIGYLCSRIAYIGKQSKQVSLHYLFDPRYRSFALVFIGRIKSGNAKKSNVSKGNAPSSIRNRMLTPSCPRWQWTMVKHVKERRRHFVCSRPQNVRPDFSNRLHQQIRWLSTDPWRVWRTIEARRHWPIDRVQVQLQVDSIIPCLFVGLYFLVPQIDLPSNTSVPYQRSTLRPIRRRLNVDRVVGIV